MQGYHHLDQLNYCLDQLGMFGKIHPPPAPTTLTFQYDLSLVMPNLHGRTNLTMNYNCHDG